MPGFLDQALLVLEVRGKQKRPSRWAASGKKSVTTERGNTMNEKSLEGVFAGLGCAFGALCILFLVALSVAANGWAIATLWGWFVVPVFGLPQLTFAQSVGVSLVGSAIFGNGNITKKSEIDRDKIWEVYFTAVWMAVALPASLVGVGWIVLKSMG